MRVSSQRTQRLAFDSFERAGRGGSARPKGAKYVQAIGYRFAPVLLSATWVTGQLVLDVSSYPAFAEDDDEPGTFTPCVAWNNGVTYAIIDAGYEQRCFRMARNCSDKQNVQVSWYATPVLVQLRLPGCPRQ
jgi:hypothetical protein